MSSRRIERGFGVSREEKGCARVGCGDWMRIGGLEVGDGGSEGSEGWGVVVELVIDLANCS
jgi:hypothetical protein